MSAGSVKAPLIIPLRLPSKGFHSNAIDTATQIEISTDTPRAQIYFTVDGSRPDPKSWKSRKPQPGPTYLYRNSFTLQSGSRTIKAMALLPDTGQESNVVAKTFDVVEAPNVNMNGEADGQPKPDDYLFFEELKREMKKVQVSAIDFPLTRRKPSTDGRKFASSLGKEDENQKRPTEENSLLSNSETETNTSSKLNKKIQSSNKGNELTLRLRTNYMFNCPACLASRPEDPDSAFCTSCGRSLPPLSSSVDISREFCPICGSKVPVDAIKCLVCESPIIESPDSTKRRICSVCGSFNPGRVKYCLTCEANLPQTPTTLVNISSFLRSSTPMPTKNSKHPSVANCRICSRENSLSARFCEWCGIQDPGEEELDNGRSCICPSCFWQLLKDSKFCSQCGFELAAIEEKNGFGDRPLIISDRFPRKTVSTQTVGPSLYSSPSSSKATEPPRIRLPMIAPVSPGKGLWRMQVEHLVAHVKAFSRNNPDFQNAISELRMGKLLSAEVIGNRPEEVSILLKFQQHNLSVQLPTWKDNDGAGDEMEVFVEAPHFAKSYYSSRSQISDYNNAPFGNPFSSTTPTEQNSWTFRRKIVALRSPSSASKLTKKSSQVHPNKLSELDNVLMRELRPGHKADMYTVERLLMNGANPSCVDHYGDPLLVRAVRNQHLEAIHVLIKSGADVNVISVRDGNTPLHEAVLLGSRVEEFVKLLLKLGANPKKKNARGLTPGELAVEADSLAAAEILANRGI